MLVMKRSFSNGREMHLICLSMAVPLRTLRNHFFYIFQIEIQWNRKMFILFFHDGAAIWGISGALRHIFLTARAFVWMLLTLRFLILLFEVFILLALEPHLVKFKVIWLCLGNIKHAFAFLAECNQDLMKSSIVVNAAIWIHICREFDVDFFF